MIEAGDYYLRMSVEYGDADLNISPAKDLGVVTDSTDFGRIRGVCKFTITEDGMWRLPGIDNLALRDSNGEYLDNGFLSTGLAAGTYYIEPMSEYIVDFSMEKIVADSKEGESDNDSVDRAYELGTLTGNLTVSDLSLHTATDGDFYSFTIENDGVWQINCDVKNPDERDYWYTNIISVDSGEAVAVGDLGTVELAACYRYRSCLPPRSSYL